MNDTPSGGFSPEAFDDCTQVSDIPTAGKTLLGFFGQEVTIQEAWKTHWDGMPRFQSTKENLHVKELLVKFSTQEDMELFAKLMKQTITPKTKSIWFPAREATTSIKRWISEDVDPKTVKTGDEPDEEETSADAN